MTLLAGAFFLPNVRIVVNPYSSIVHEMDWVVLEGLTIATNKKDKPVVIGKRYIVRGRVQRVGFRAFVVRSAKKHGIWGSVRNLSDGTVAIHAGGSVSNLEAFEADIHRGTLKSHVEAVDTSSADVPLERRFVVQRG